MYWFCSPTMKLPRQLGKKLWLVEGVFTKWPPLTSDLDPFSIDTMIQCSFSCADVNQSLILLQIAKFAKKNYT